MPVKGAFVTLLTKDEYLPGTLVVHTGLNAVGSKYPFVVLVTSALSQDARAVLQRRGIEVQHVDPLMPPSGTNTLPDHDARFADTWTKLRAFDLKRYDRVVMMDSDMIVRRNMDELMDLNLLDDWIAAAHACTCNPRKLPHYPEDWKPENCPYTPLVHTTDVPEPTAIEPSSPRTYGLLNSGLVVLTPSAPLAKKIDDFLRTSPLVENFSFPDQDLLAEFFRGKWRPLPWIYNALKTLRVIHKPLWRDEEVRCLHYILHDKPWLARVEKGSTKGYDEVHRWWWDDLDKLVAELDQSDREMILAKVAPPL